VLPAVAMTSIFMYIILPEAPVGKLLALFAGGNAPELFGLKSARYTVIAYFFLTNFGGQFVLLSGAMARVPKECLESAYLDGAGMRTELLRIIFPLCWPTVSMILLLNLAGLFTASGPVLLLTNGKANSSTVGFWLFNGTLNGSYYMPAAVGVVCTVVLLPVVLLARRGLGRIYADVEF
jgi:ABC-type sugar transport system permease subunit